jgi:CPA2 family monovalent cation:H+ antiporter-2
VSGIQFIGDLAVVLVVAGLAAWLCQRLRLSAVVGYLVAGAIIGPNTPPFALVSDPGRVETLAQVGLVFLIFSIGLNLSLSRLRSLGLSVVAATVIGALLVLNGCRLFGWALGWGDTASLFLAGMLMVSSSAIIGKVLDELNLTHERPGQLALGVTVLEDVLAVTMLTLLTSLIQFGGDKPPPVLSTVGALGAFVVFLALASLLLVPKLLARLGRHALSEIRTLVVAGLLLALAWGAVQAGYSLALGAFVFGAIVGSTRYKADIERTFGGLQQTFGAVFFVAIGMQVDFQVLLGAWPLVLAVTGLALVLRPLACTLGLIAVGNSSRESLQAGLTLTPLGEFSFIIAQLGVTAGVVPPSFYPVAVGASLLTSLAAPVLTRQAETWSQRLAQAQPRRVREWVEFYHDWLTRLRQRQTASFLWQLTRKRLVQVGVHILFVSALILFANPVYEQAKGWVGRDWPWPNGLPFLFWSAFGLVLLGPLIALWRNVSAMAMILAESATSGSPRQRRLRPLLEAALRAVASVVLVAWLLALLPSGWSLLGAAGAVLAWLVGVTLVFWKRFVHLHSRFEIELMEQLKRASHVTASSAWSNALPAQTADWNLDINELTLPSDSVHAGRTLGQLAVRQRFGCSVIGIDRQGFGIVNPSADTVLYPQDKLLMLGTAEQLARAAQELGRPAAALARTADFDALTMESVIVPDDSPLAGKPLLELDLIRQAGVQIGGIRRGRQRNLAPSGQDRFQAGDELLVLGSHEQINRFRVLLSPPPSAVKLAPDQT